MNSFIMKHKNYVCNKKLLIFTSFFTFQAIFSQGSYIIRQDTSGDTFYIISEGKVKVTKRIEGKKTLQT